jgi:hypothetical protein
MARPVFLLSVAAALSVAVFSSGREHLFQSLRIEADHYLIANYNGRC